MSTPNEFFDRIFCINLDRSPERWEHVQMECEKHNLQIERFSGVDASAYVGLPDNLRAGMANAMFGCTASHGALLNVIAYHGWRRVLILEDDFEILHDDFNDRFAAMMPRLPEGWELVYLGAGYGDKPLGRINDSVIMAGSIKTTSSYAVTGKYARWIAPFMCGGSAPDDLLSGFNPYHQCYVLEPRLMGQYPNTSTIWGKFTHNTQSMTDPHHVAMLGGHQSSSPPASPPRRVINHSRMITNPPPAVDPPPMFARGTL